MRDPQLLLITKANSRSTVHRGVYLDYIGIKTFDKSGAVIGERRFLGLFTSVAYTQSVWKIPLLKSKSAAVLERSGFNPRSHSGKDLVEIIEDYPRDELFQMSVPELYETTMGVLYLQERRRLRLFMRRDVYGRFVSCLVYLPRERYDTQVRLKMRAILLDALGGSSIDDTFRVAESVLARVHFVVRVDSRSPVEVDRDELESRLVVATRTWEDDFADALAARFGDLDATVAARYVDAFPEAYKEDFAATVAVDDLQRLDALHDDGDLDVELYEPLDKEACDLAVKLFRRGAPVSLSYMLPILQSMGVEVTDERPYEIERRDGTVAWIYDFGLRHAPVADEAAAATLHERFQDALAAAWHGRAEVDGFQALVLEAGLTWRQVTIIRAYAKYLRQAGYRFSQTYLESALRANTQVVRLLVSLFEARFDPAFARDRAGAEMGIVQDLEQAFDAVASLDEDRILRSFLLLMLATRAHEPLAARRRWRTEGLPLVEDRVAVSGRSARAAAVVRDLGVLAAHRGCASSVRSDRARRHQILRPPRGLPHRGARAGEDADGEERGDRAGRLEGWLRRQAPARRSERPQGAAGRGRRVLPHVDQRLARPHRQSHRARRGAADGAPERRRPPRWRRQLSRGGSRQGHGYVLRPRQRYFRRLRVLARRCVRVGWLGRLRPQGHGYHRPRRMGVGEAPLPRARRRTARPPTSPVSVSATCRATCSATACCFHSTSGCSPRSTTGTSSSTPTPTRRSSFVERQRLFDLAGSSWADYDRQLISAGGGVWPRSAKSIPVSPEMAAALGINAGGAARPMT